MIIGVNSWLQMEQRPVGRQNVVMVITCLAGFEVGPFKKDSEKFWLARGMGNVASGSAASAAAPVAMTYIRTL